MINYSTGYKTKTGEEIILGDKIKGNSSVVVVVLWGRDKKDFIVEIADAKIQERIGYNEMLKEFMAAWNGFNKNSTIEKVGSILER
jgi:hypothetical protein